MLRKIFSPTGITARPGVVDPRAQGFALAFGADADPLADRAVFQRLALLRHREAAPLMTTPISTCPRSTTATGAAAGAACAAPLGIDRHEDPPARPAPLHSTRTISARRPCQARVSDCATGGQPQAPVHRMPRPAGSAQRRAGKGGRLRRRLRPDRQTRIALRCAGQRKDETARRVRADRIMARLLGKDHWPSLCKLGATACDPVVQRNRPAPVRHRPAGTITRGCEPCSLLPLPPAPRRRAATCARVRRAIGAFSTVNCSPRPRRMPRQPEAECRPPPNPQTPRWQSLRNAARVLRLLAPLRRHARQSAAGNDEQDQRQVRQRHQPAVALPRPFTPPPPARAPWAGPEPAAAPASRPVAADPRPPAPRAARSAWRAD